MTQREKACFMSGVALTTGILSGGDMQRASAMLRLFSPNFADFVYALGEDCVSVADEVRDEIDLLIQAAMVDKENPQ